MATFGGGAQVTTAGQIANGLITDVHISNTAAITLSKLAAIAAGSVLMGNGSNVPTATAVSGDVALGSTGAATVSLLKGSATAVGGSPTLTVSSLDLNTDKRYLVIFQGSFVTAGANVSLRVNGDTTATNYNRVEGKISGTGITVSSPNNDQVGDSSTSVGYTLQGFLVVDVEGTPRFTGLTNSGNATGDVGDLDVVGWVHNNTTNVTSVSITGSQNMTANSVLYVLKA